MIERIRGEVLQINPTEVVLQATNFAFAVQITLNTFHEIKDEKQVDLFTHMHFKNEGQSLGAIELYGFSTELERSYFQTVIGVSGIGTSTARIMLSSLSPKEISQAILLEDVSTITTVKGIGPKTAKRLILELKDKLPANNNLGTDFDEKISPTQNNTIETEALSALVMLGFSNKMAQKAIKKVIKETPVTTVEELVKQCLKSL